MIHKTQTSESSAPVDMSADAIAHRLQLVGQLNDLCRFLQTGKRPEHRIVDAECHDPAEAQATQRADHSS